MSVKTLQLLKHSGRMLIALLLVTLANVFVCAQTDVTGSMTGLVRNDLDGSPVPDALVRIVNVSISRQVLFSRTDQEGVFVINRIRQGLYDIETSCDGYEVIATSKVSRFIVEFKRSNLVKPPPLQLKRIVITVPRPDQAIPPTQAVRVVNTSPPLGDTGATRELILNRDIIEALPLAGLRTFDNLALLAAGVSPPPEAIGLTLGPGLGAGVGTAGQMSVNGLRSRGNNFTVDGSDNNDEDIGVRRQGFTSLVPQSVESIDQISITTALAGPQFSRSLGGQINVVSRYGGDQIRGEFYGFFTDKDLQSRNPFDLTNKDAPPTFALQKCTPPAQFCSSGIPIRINGQPIVMPNPVGGENPLTQLQMGGIVSGPLPGRRAFILASLERRKVHASRESSFAVPTVSQRGLFNSGDQGLEVVDTNNRVRPVIPTSIGGSAFFSLYPFPNNPRGPYGDNTFTRILPADASGDIGSLVVGQDLKLFGSKQDLVARFNITNDRTKLPVTGEALFSSMISRVKTRNLSIIFGGAVSSTSWQEFRFSYGRTRLAFDEYRDPYSDYLLPSKLTSNGREIPFLLNSRLLRNFTLPGRAPGYTLIAGQDSEGDIITGLGTGPIGQVKVSGFSSLGVDVNNFPQKRANNTFQIAETLNHYKRNQNVKWGVDIRRIQLNSQLDRNFRPIAHFSGPGNLSRLLNRPGTSVIDNKTFLGSDMVALGAPTSFIQTQSFTPDSTIGLRFIQSSYFIEDNIKIAPGLNVLLGLRYHLNTVPREVNGRIEKTFQSEELSRIIAIERDNFGVSGLNNFIAGRKEIFGKDLNNIAPHIALAWDPFRKGKTAIRAGYGVYFDQIPGAVISQSRNVFPTFLSFNVVGVSNPLFPSRLYHFNPSRFAENGSLNRLDKKYGANAADILVNIYGLINNRDGYVLTPSFVLPEARLKTPSSNQWGLTIEQTLARDLQVSLSYIGTKGSHLLRFATPNLGPQAVPLISDLILNGIEVNALGEFRSPGRNVNNKEDLLRPFPFAGSFNLITADSNSIYHGLQAEASRRLSGGLKFTLAYTWSKAIDEVSDIFDLAGSAGLPQNSFNYKAERATANYDIRHRFAGSFVWDVPWLRNKGFLGGWKLAGIVNIQSGQPFTVNTGTDVNLDGNVTDRLNSLVGIVKKDEGSQQYQFPREYSEQEKLLALPGQDGQVGRNSFISAGVANIDLALSNQLIKLGETRSLELRLEVFNLTNRSHFAIPVRTLFSPGLGNSVKTTVPARTFQIVLRLKL